ncbi:hypothetical protein [Falsiroseomonas sp. CW058]|uniref:hypothetical protein n=1 Tax=Falsiroseomonas sp. CW058 TaxID=3388664 RepID=UPI003D322C18
MAAVTGWQGPGGALGPVLASRAMAWTLGGLLALDLVFLGLHVAHVAAEWRGQGPFAGRAFSIEAEGGHAESYEALKTAACVVALGLCARRSGAPVYGALAFVFAAALADNALMLHERAGSLLAPALMPAAGLFQAAPQAFGELGFFAVLGGLALLLLAAGFRRSAAPHRRAGAGFVVLLALLAGFGVALDLLHAALGGQRRAFDRVLGTVEDGGELVVLSAACALAVALARRLAWPAT